MVGGSAQRSYKPHILNLETMNKKIKLSAFLGLRSDRGAILIDKVDLVYGIKVSSDIGMQMPVLADASMKAMLSQLSDEGIDEVLTRTELKRYTRHFIIDKGVYKEEIFDVYKVSPMRERSVH
jgi:DNA-binding IclR family transcriptional regulator